MYKQTDKEIAIYRKIDGERINVTKKWGCLYASLLYIVEDATGSKFSPSQVKLLYRYLICIKAIRKDMYIKNHISVLRNACRVLGYEPKEIKYIAHVDYEKRSETWGKTEGYTHMLKEDRLDENTVHFLHEDFNPYPDVTGKPISHRYYRIIV